MAGWCGRKGLELSRSEFGSYLLFSRCVTRGKQINILGPQFLLKNQDNGAY